MEFYFAQRIKYLVEVDKHLPLRNLCDVVHALAGIVANAGILVDEAGKDWRDDFFKIASDFLVYIVSSSFRSCLQGICTGPRAIEAAARPISPPLRECGSWTAYA